MTPNRSEILDQLAAGQISADEAARLMNPPRITPSPATAGRWLHIRVTDLTTGQSRVTVNLPFSLVEVGLRLGSRFTSEFTGLDMESLLAELRAAPSGTIVEVEDIDDGERVEVSVD